MNRYIFSLAGFMIAGASLAQQPIVGAGGVTAVTDSATINFTLALPNITAVLTCDPAADNLLACGPSGAFADEDADAHAYDNTFSGLVAADVQAAIDEIVSGAVFSASNGLTLLGTDVRLGGLLTASTTIDGVNTFDLDLQQLSNFSLDVNGTADLTADELLLVGVSDLKVQTPSFGGASEGMVLADQGLGDGSVEYEFPLDTLTQSAPGGVVGDVIVWDGTNWQSGTGSPAVTAVTDTSSIDLTLTGFTLSSDVIVSPAADNLLQSLAGGLFADEDAAAHVYDNTTSLLLGTDVQTAVDQLSNSDEFFAVDGVAAAAWQNIGAHAHHSGGLAIGYGPFGSGGILGAPYDFAVNGDSIFQNADATRFFATGGVGTRYLASGYEKAEFLAAGVGLEFNATGWGTINLSSPQSVVQVTNNLLLTSTGVVTISSTLAGGHIRMQPLGYAIAPAGSVLAHQVGANGEVDYETVLGALAISTPGGFVGDSIYWDGTGWNTGGPPPVAVAPACAAGQAGAFYRDTDASNTLCYCDGTSWLPAAGAGPCA